MRYVKAKELEQMSASEANRVLIELQRRVKKNEERLDEMETKYSNGFMNE